MRSIFAPAAFALLLLQTGLALAADAPPDLKPSDLKLPVAAGPFQPTMDSLKQYQCPDWFRDAKFGIWAHWGPQSVPMEGDWYARHMYEQGSPQNKYHVEHYGPPSQFGYKDIIPLWKAEKWDPDRLMQLYKKAGAKYFVSMGSHHDDFFLWDSKLHKWNAVNMGPKRDVVGDWQKAATKYGLKFGVSEHLAPASPGSRPATDPTRRARLPACPTTAPILHSRTSTTSPPSPATGAGTATIPAGSSNGTTKSRNWSTTTIPTCCIATAGCAFGNEVGRSMIAHLYNSNAALHGGQTQAVYNCKQKSEGRWVEDLERGIMASIDPHPWQTDTSIGDWFYNRNWKFRPVSWVIDMLVDNVSKNGNLLLNVVQRPDGSLDPEVEQMLGQLADWTAIHGEAIYGSRPWQIYGESAVKVKGGRFREDLQVQRQGNPLHDPGPGALRHRPGLAGGRSDRRPFAGQAGRRERQQHHRRQPPGL